MSTDAKTVYPVSRLNIGMYGSVPVNNVIFSLKKNIRFTVKSFAYADLLCKQLERVKTGIHINIPKNKKVYSNKTINLIQ